MPLQRGSSTSLDPPQLAHAAVHEDDAVADDGDEEAEYGKASKGDEQDEERGSNGLTQSVVRDGSLVSVHGHILSHE